MAQLDNDINTLISLSKSSDASVRSQAQKALLTTTEFNNIDFDVAASYYDDAKSNPDIERLFRQMYEDKKIDEIGKFKEKDIAGINQYANMSDNKMDLTLELLENSIYDHKDELSLQELNYICAELPKYHNSDFNKERSTRIPEIQTVLKRNVSTYVNDEAKFIRNFNYIIEKSAYEYLYECYQHIAKAYSTVSKVPGDVESMEAQYRYIVSKVMAGEEFRKYMQQEVDLFCEHVDNGRLVYCMAAGKPSFEKLSIQVPEITFSGYSAVDSSLVNIVAEREDYESTQNTVNGVATAVGIIGGIFGMGLGGSLLTTGVKTLAKMYFSSEMVERITMARKNYMNDVLLAMESDVRTQSEMIQESLGKQLMANEKKFKEYVEK